MILEGFFNRTKIAVEDYISSQDTYNKSVNEVIEEIHETFYTEVDRLLEEAKQLTSVETIKQSLIDKCNRLKDLGFTNTKEVKEAEEELRRLQGINSDNHKKSELVKAIEYFSFKYPQYKFITEESVKNICEKYNLIYGEISRYVGAVPDKNLKHIEDFKIDENDCCYIVDGYCPKDIKGKVGSKGSSASIKNSFYGDYNIYYYTKPIPFEIAAPLKDFNTEGMELKGRKLSKIEIPDPVVLKPVIFNGVKHFLVVTAWGLEAEDELVVNPNMN